MKPLTTNLQSLSLILLSSVFASNPAAANDLRLHIEANSTMATMQLCDLQEGCASIQVLSTTPPTTPNDQESKSTEDPEENSSLIDQINTNLFGF